MKCLSCGSENVVEVDNNNCIWRCGDCGWQGIGDEFDIAITYDWPISVTPNELASMLIQDAIDCCIHGADPIIVAAFCLGDKLASAYIVLDDGKFFAAHFKDGLTTDLLYADDIFLATKFCLLMEHDFKAAYTVSGVNYAHT